MGLATLFSGISLGPSQATMLPGWTKGIPLFHSRRSLQIRGFKSVFPNSRRRRSEEINPELPGSGVVFLCNYRGTLLLAQSVPMTSSSVVSSGAPQM